VLAGGGDAALPAHPWLHRLGYVEDQVVHDALASAAVVVLPSPYESLSLVQLEAWGHGRPTLANAASPVLVGQSRRAGGGLWYRDGDEYAAMLDLLATAAPLARAIGRQGGRFVAEACSWDRVRDVWLDALALAAGPRAAAVGPGG
jgi:glycosyltransferase involved in cell wall biosynthesis